MKAEYAAAVETIHMSEEAIEKLNPSQIRFVVNYLKTGNASKAARDAGYSTSTKDDLLKNPVIAAEIRRLKRELADLALQKGILSKDEGSLILARIAREQNTEKRDRINAMKVLGDFHGWKAPAKINHNVSGKVFGFLSTIQPTESRSAIAAGSDFVNVVPD